MKVDPRYLELGLSLIVCSKISTRVGRTCVTVQSYHTGRPEKSDHISICRM